ncbi:MAG: hypothetical protein ACLSUS_08115 [Opitutales bacterium]|jgi:hypothetical protein
MIVNFNFSKPVKGVKIANSMPKPINFKAGADTFEKNTKEKDIELTVYNPYVNTVFHIKTPVDLTKKQQIVITSKYSRFAGKKLVVDYDPQRYDYIFDKKSNRREKTMILVGHDERKPNEISYHFMSRSLSKEYGYVHLSLHRDPRADLKESSFLDRELLINYPKHKIQGPRVIVEYLQNWEDSKKGGIGRLADKLAVKYCIENNIKPVIISNADRGSHVAHYLRGKRFLPPEKDTSSYDYLAKNYGCTNLNKILAKLLKDSEKNEEKIDLGDLGMFPMYMPEELAQKYVKELESEKKL